MVMTTENIPVINVRKPEKKNIRRMLAIAGQQTLTITMKGFCTTMME